MTENKEKALVEVKKVDRLTESQLEKVTTAIQKVEESVDLATIVDQVKNYQRNEVEKELGARRQAVLAVLNDANSLHSSSKRRD